MRHFVNMVCRFPAVLAAAFACAAAPAQDYPNKPIRIVASEPGGSNDFMARLVAQGLTGSLGQSVIVDNRPTVLTGEIVSKAQPDGYTLLLQASSFITGHLLQKTTYDPIKDFSPITLLVNSPNILVVHPSLPAGSVKEFIALAKAKPGGLNYGSGNTGAQTHLGAELFNSMAGVKIVHIPYKGAGAAVNSLIAGDVQMMIATASSVTPHVKSGRLRALAVTSAQPTALVPGLPTVAASGLPGYDVVAINAIWAPAKTPAAIINRLNREIVRVINQPDMKEKFFNAGVDAVGSSPEQLAAFMKSDIARWSKVIKDAGIRVE